MKKTMMIFGVNSFVGSNIANFFKDKYRVVGTYHSRVVHIPGVLCLECDVLNRDSVQLLIFKFAPKVTIFVVGLTSIYECNEDQRVADALNSVGAINVATFSERYKSKLIYISTAFVFSGENKERNEQEAPDPTTVYGKTKAQAEFFIQKTCLNYLIFRSCALFGRGLSENLTFFEKLQKYIFLGKDADCDNFIYSGFLHVDYLCTLIKRALDLDVTNRLLQMSSYDVMTHYEFANLYCEIFRFNSANIKKTKWIFPETKAPMSIGEKGEDVNKRYFKMKSEVCESTLEIMMPSIRESLLYSSLKYGGTTVVSTTASAGVQYI